MQWPDGTCAGTGGDDETVAALERVGGTTDRRTSVRDIILPDGRWGRALVEIVAPPPELVVFGAGDDAMPLAQGAKALGWHVTVVDHRPACATATRFPWADAIHCLRPDAVAERPHLVPADALAMVMTHHFEHDRGLLSFLIDRPLRYLGILGPASRTQRLLDGCGKGTTPVLHGPAGLDLGAETPEEIALSILAEMQAALTRRPATPLRSRHGPIHATIAA